MKEEKQITIDSALAKLTEEEKVLLGLVKKEKKPIVKKNYKLKVYYMIGDANGHTDKEATISAKNPFLPLVTDALDKLKLVKGRWGMVLDKDFYQSNLSDGNISMSEYSLLQLVSGYGFDEDDASDFFKENGFEENEANYYFLNEFEGVFTNEASYSFLVYEFYTLR